MGRAAATVRFIVVQGDALGYRVVVQGGALMGRPNSSPYLSCRIANIHAAIARQPLCPPDLYHERPGDASYPEFAP